MDKADQRRIVNEMIEAHGKTMRELVEKVPAHWDGIELRALFADRAAEDFDYKRVMAGARLRDYKNTRLVQNLCFAALFILSALPALAQAPKPVTVKMPTMAAPVYRTPKPTVVTMPKPPATIKRFPTIKPVHFPPPHFTSHR